MSWFKRHRQRPLGCCGGAEKTTAVAYVYAVPLLHAPVPSVDYLAYLITSRMSHISHLFRGCTRAERLGLLRHLSGASESTARLVTTWLKAVFKEEPGAGTRIGHPRCWVPPGCCIAIALLADAVCIAIRVPLV